MFLVDDRILPMMTKALGKAFFGKKKQPVPLRLRGIVGGDDPAKVLARIEAARARTYMYRSSGSCLSVRMARTNFTPEQVVENVMQGTEAVVRHLGGKWKHVISVSIKTPDSVALPIYNKLPSRLIQADKAPAPAPAVQPQPQPPTEPLVKPPQPAGEGVPAKLKASKRRLEAESVESPTKKAKEGVAAASAGQPKASVEKVKAKAKAPAPAPAQAPTAKPAATDKPKAGGAGLATVPPTKTTGAKKADATPAADKAKTGAKADKLPERGEAAGMKLRTQVSVQPTVDKAARRASGDGKAAGLKKKTKPKRSSL
jgi:ribosome biogenesis protein UTP30